MRRSILPCVAVIRQTSSVSTYPIVAGPGKGNEEVDAEASTSSGR